MDSSASQWLAELENDDLGGLEFIDPLSMQQLAESLANELWNEPRAPQEQQQEQNYQPQQCTPPPKGFAFVGDLNLNTANGRCPTPVVSAGGIDNMFSFTAGGLSAPLNFTAQEETGQAESVATGSTVGKCCSSSTTEKKSGGRKPSSSVKEHVIAERKRREKMHHQFATLASIIPDITKTDKVSVLGSTIEYLHHLRNRLRTLQEQQHQQGSSTAESPTTLNARRCCIASEGDGAASPKIEADVQGTTVLLRVVCRKKKGVLIMVLTELEKHRLSIINTNVVPFAKSSLNITITAQIEDGSSTTVELVNNLNSALKKF
ncbi:transcription factor bHLH19-like [Setaria italica]|uniref:BHLH domain-containing protein n=2 Tax=Setaria TaxID=4554 RepID=K4ACR6_SETIT|nr:transcription factor bHLH19-like [Setaria italica]XP_034577216.1 transcription factor bHLH19-like [Setaria viridis]